MSYILEALKKSEQERERERGGLPDIKSIHTPAIPHKSEGVKWWPIVLITLLVIAGAASTVAYIKFVQPGATGVPDVASVPAEPVEPQSSTPQSAVPENKAATDTKPVESIKPDEAATAKMERKAPRVVFSEQQLQHDDVVGNINEQQKQAAVELELKLTAKQAGTVVQEKAVPIADIPDDIRKNIPRIAFEGHVYSSTPSRRSVMINGHKMREGDAIGEDLMLKRITPEGAEFEYRGYIFKLGALQDWSFN